MDIFHCHFIRSRIRSLIFFTTQLVVVTAIPAINTHAQQTFSITLSLDQPQPLMADAGSDIASYTQPTSLGGTPAASGGTSPYSYLWSPAEQLSSVVLPNPILTLPETIKSILFQLIVTDARGCTQKDEMQVGETVTHVIGNESQFKIYPNPSNQILFVESDKKITELRLFSSSGKLLINEVNKGTKIEIKLPGSSNGFYILTLKIGDQLFTRKIVVGSNY